MNAKLPPPNHESYKRHRKENFWQVIFPVALTALLLIVFIVFINIATFRDNGEVGRWAAVSTMWIVIPIMIGLFIVLASMAGLVYLMARLLNVTPTYTSLAQYYVNLGVSYVKQATESIIKPVIKLNEVLAGTAAFFEKIKPYLNIKK